MTFNLPDSSVSTAKIGDAQVTTPKVANGAITAVKLSSMGAATGQLLKWNGTTWTPSNLDALTYAGTWDASLGNTSPNVSATNGEYYIVSAAGTADPGDGNSRYWYQGDWIVYNATTSTWDQISNTSDVTSFNGRTGGIIPAANDYTWAQINKTTSSIGDIADVDLTVAPTNGQVLKWNGTSWKAAADKDTGVSADSVNSGSIVDGSIVDADINSSAAIAQSKIANLSTDLASKLPLAGGTMSGDIVMGANNITFSTGLVDGVDVSALSAQVGTKESSIMAGTTSQYFRGDKSWQTLDTSVVPENTNLYFTTTRAKTAAVSNSLLSGVLDIAPSQDAVVTALATKQGTITSSTALNVGSVTSNLQGGINANPFGTLAGQTGEFRFYELAANGTNYVGLKAPDVIGANQIWTLPATDGTSGQVLSTNGAGVLAWTSTTSGTVTSVTATAPLSSTGGATPNLTISQANGTTNGYLTSTDWNIFNSKQGAIAMGTTAQYLKGDLTLGTFATDVQGTALSSYAVGTNTALATTDSVSGAFGKVQSQINATNTQVTTNASAIAGKENSITAGSTVQYWRGDKSWQTLDTSVVPENTNLYFSNARAKAAAVSNSLTAAVLDVAPSQDAVVTALATKQATITNSTPLNVGSVTSNLQGGINAGPYGTVAGQTGEFRFYELAANGTNYVGLKAPDVIGANQIWTLPATDGTSGQVLSTNGAGVLAWTSTTSGTVTNVTATAPLSSSGGATPNLTITQANGTTNGYLTSTDWNTFNNKEGALTKGNLTESTSGVLTITNGTGSVIGTGTTIQVKKATGATNGYLSSTDWTTFNNKQNAITTGTTAQYLKGDLSLGTFATDVQGTALSSYAVGTNTALATTDSVSGAFGKVQGQINATNTALGNYVLKAGDTMTGTLNLPANGLVAGTNQLVLKSGRVGVGTASPSFDLSFGGDVARSITMENNSTTVGSSLSLVAGGALNGGTNLNGGNLYLKSGTSTGNGSSDIYFQTATGGAFGTANNTPSTKMTIWGNGNVGIGTTTPQTKLDVAGEIVAQGRISLTDYATPSSAVNPTWHIDNTADKFRIFRQPTLTTPGTSMISIDNTGNVGIGTETPTEKIEIIGDGRMKFGANSTWGASLIVGGNGHIGTDASVVTTNGNLHLDAKTGAFATYVNWYEGTSGLMVGNATGGGYGMVRAAAFTVSSDLRLKREITPVQNSLDKIYKIKGVHYFYKNPKYEQEKQIGVIAQDVLKVFPEIVRQDKDGIYSVDYPKLVVPLIEATKEIDHNLRMFKIMQEGIDNEQNRRISSLEEEVKELRVIKQKYNSLKEYLCAKDPNAPFCAGE